MDLKNTQLLRICVLSLVFISGHVFCDKLESGTDHIFKPSITGTPQTILWKYKGNKVVEFESNEPYWYRLKGRAELNTTTGDLTLHNLHEEDSGLYESEIQVAGVIRSSRHDIEVIDGVPKPKVTCEIREGRKILSCSLTTPVQASFTWSGPAGFTHIGQSLEISEETGLDLVYFCTAMNDVSKSSTEFKLRECEKDGVSENNTPVIVVSVLGVLAGLAALAGVVYYKFFPRNVHDRVSSN